MVMTPDSFRAAFPFFAKHPNWCYLDSASTTLRHEYCNTLIRDHHDLLAINPGKASYSLSLAAQKEVKDIREKVAEHFGCRSAEEVFFVSSATSAMQILARLWMSLINTEEEILICSEDHISTVGPWIELVRNFERLKVPVRLHEYSLDSTGAINIDTLFSNLNENTSVVVLTHAHNLSGTINDVETICKKLPPHLFTVLDATQSAGHIPFSFKGLGVKAALFSGHKCFALPGTGCLFIDQKWLEESGLCEVNRISARNSLEGLRELIEPGSQNLIASLSIKHAIELQKAIFESGLDEQVRECSKLLHSAITVRPALTPVFMKGKESKYHSCGTHSFLFENLDAGTVCEFLEQEGFLVRGGKQCVTTQRAQQAIRISLQAYNTPSEVERLVEKLDILSDKTGVVNNWV